MEPIYFLSIALMIVVAIAASAQQAASDVASSDFDLAQILLYIQKRDTSIAEWVEKYRQAEHESDAKKNEALTRLVAALNRSAAASEASVRAPEFDQKLKCFARCLWEGRHGSF